MHREHGGILNNKPRAPSAPRGLLNILIFFVSLVAKRLLECSDNDISRIDIGSLRIQRNLYCASNA